MHDNVAPDKIKLFFNIFFRIGILMWEGEYIRLFQPYLLLIISFMGALGIRCWGQVGSVVL